MLDVTRIRGILFDYGGTIDSNGVHWAEVIWQAYQAENIPITKEHFREAYVHGERTLGKNPIIQPHHTFLDMLKIKIEIQRSPPQPPRRGGERAIEEQFLPEIPPPLRGGTGWGSHIADRCYEYARASIENARPVIEWLAGKYPLVMVTNFYGNMRSVLKDFQIDHFFPVIIESAIVGVRKPDPQIFGLGVEALQLQANEVVVIGDSYDKDIVPAKTTGCQTIWLKKTGWNAYTGNETADLTISDFAELRKWL